MVYIILILLGTISIISYLLHIRICSFYYLTGFPCPGCGLTRGFIELFKFHIKKSIQYNMLCIPILLSLIIYFLFIILNKKDKFNNFIYKHRFIIILLAFIMMLASFIKNINNPILY